MKRRQLHANHKRRSIIEPLDESGRVYLAMRGGKPVGTIRGNTTADAQAGYYRNLYQIDRFNFADPATIQISTKLMIDPDYAGSTLTPRMLSLYAAEGYRLGMRVDFVDCNKHLIGFFEKLGYFSYCGWRFHKEFGAIRPMFFAVDAVDYLHELRSIIAALARATLVDGQYGGYELIRKFATPPKNKFGVMAYEKIGARELLA
jgi:hypothetical protein